MRTCLSSIARFVWRSFLLVSASIVLFVTAGCDSGNRGASTITVFAAASLTGAFQEIAAEFESRNPGVQVRLNFAGSQRLRSQLEFGAAADVFASADEVQMSLAEESGIVGKDSRPFASAGMAVIASTDSRIIRLSDISRPGVKVVIAHGSVPAGRYARSLLERLSEPGTGLGDDFAARVMANAVSEETSVKFVEQKVILGEAHAGIVYRPGAISAKSAGSVRELPLPHQASEVRALFPIAVVQESASPELAAGFVEFALSGPAQGILAEYGFDAP